MWIYLWPNQLGTWYPWRSPISTVARRPRAFYFRNVWGAVYVYLRLKSLLKKHIYMSVGPAICTHPSEEDSWYSSSKRTEECLPLALSSSLCWLLLSAPHLHLASSPFTFPRGKASLLSVRGRSRSSHLTHGTPAQRTVTQVRQSTGLVVVSFPFRVIARH